MQRASSLVIRSFLPFFRVVLAGSIWYNIDNSDYSRALT
jgi:hypothetical protein